MRDFFLSFFVLTRRVTDAIFPLLVLFTSTGEAMGDLALFVAKSGNKKLGDAATTYASDLSCPVVCPFKASGECYGFGYHARRVWKSVSKFAASFAQIAEAEAEAIDGCKVPKRDLRIHTLGDCSTSEAARIVAAAAVRYVERAAAKGKSVAAWSYSHAWRTVERGAWAGVSVLASVESADDARAAQARGWVPAFVMGEFPSDKLFVVDGVKVLPCPEQTGRAESCVECRLCLDDSKLRERGLCIGFQAHGPKQKQMRARMAV